MWLDTTGKNLSFPLGTQVFYEDLYRNRIISAKNGIYLWKLNYINENRIISTKIELYLRNGNYLISNDFFIAE